MSSPELMLSENSSRATDDPNALLIPIISTDAILVPLPRARLSARRGLDVEATARRGRAREQ